MSNLPKTQRAVIQALPTTNLSLIHDHPVPTPSFDNGEHLIQVYTTAPCKNELTWPINFAAHFPASRVPIPSNDLAGVVVSAPPQSPFQPGARVFARTPASRAGDASDYTIALTSELARVPPRLSWVEAAAVPMSAETAWQGLFTQGGLAEPGSGGEAANAGRSVLVTGASGSVGAWMVQLAKAAGVGRIVGVASGENADLVRSLGADEVVDYRKADLAEWGRAESGRSKVDLVLDCAGNETLAKCWYCVKEGGKLLSVCQPPEQKKPEDVEAKWEYYFFIMTSDGPQLAKVAEMIEQGKCKPFVDSVWPLEDFEKVWDLVDRGKPRGKVIIEVNK